MLKTHNLFQIKIVFFKSYTLEVVECLEKTHNLRINVYHPSSLYQNFILCFDFLHFSVMFTKANMS